MAKKPTQQLFDFVPARIAPVSASFAARYEPPDEVLAAFERLEDFLLDACGKPVNGVTEEVLSALARALREGKNAWRDRAEELLLALQSCPSLAGIEPTKEGEFLSSTEDLLACLRDSSRQRHR